MLDESRFFESAFRKELAAQLRRQGWRTELEHRTPYGRIDMLAQKGAEVRIIETKMGTSRCEIAHGLGQLMFYTLAYPQASLWLATPRRPADAFLEILNTYKVSYMTLDRFRDLDE